MVSKLQKNGSKIEKAEDKLWKEWFSGLKENEHDKLLQQIGLDDEDIKDWHSSHGKVDSFFEEPELTELQKKNKK